MPSKEIKEIFDNEYEEKMKHFKCVKTRRLSKRVTCYVGLLYNLSHSDFLVLVLRDEETGRWISMKMKTVRHLLKFLLDKNLVEARRLNFVERYFSKPSEAEIEHKKKLHQQKLDEREKERKIKETKKMIEENIRKSFENNAFDKDFNIDIKLTPKNI